MPKLNKSQHRDIFRHLDRAAWLIAGCESAIDRALQVGGRQDVGLEALKKITSGLAEALGEHSSHARDQAGIKYQSPEGLFIRRNNDFGLGEKKPNSSLS